MGKLISRYGFYRSISQYWRKHWDYRLRARLGGQLAEKAVWVDEAKCIGCQYCVHVASNTFTVDEFHGRSRAIRQDGDSFDVIQEAIDTCPVDCIHWVKFEELDDLENSLDRDMFQTFGKPPRMNKH